VLETDPKLSSWCNKAVQANWDAGTNITPETQRIQMETSIALANFNKNVWLKIKSYPWKKFQNSTLRRQFKLMSNIGTDALGTLEIAEYTNITTEMQNIYSTAVVRDFKDPNKRLSLTPEIDTIMSESNDPNELEYLWTGWRNASGRKMTKLYQRYVELENEAAKLNGFKNAYEGWTDTYDSPDFARDIEKLWTQIEPLYKELHAYARRALVKLYPGKVTKDGLIPAHLLGNMWGKNLLTKPVCAVGRIYEYCRLISVIKALCQDVN
jgi:hypothetical protein